MKIRNYVMSGIAFSPMMLELATTFVPASAYAADDHVGSFEEIVVTARRKSENVAKVPTTVIAMSTEALREQRIEQQSDLQAAVPGLTVRETQANNQLNYAIRGQTVDAFSGASTAVVPYVNEVPFTTSGAAAFFDLESVQVLKGPQGTLFGRNATGGAVLSTTAKPRDEFSSAITLGYGNYDYKNAEVMVNVPLVTDKVLLRLATKILRRDGYIENVFKGPVYGGNDNSRLGELHDNAFRASLLVRPTSNIENLTVVQYEGTKGNNSATQIYSVNPCTVPGTGGTQVSSGLPCPAAALFGPQLDAAFGFPGAWATYLAANPGANPGGIFAALDRQKNQLGFWQVDEDNPSFHRGKDWFVTNTTTFDVNDNVQIKNIFGYSTSEVLDSTSATGEPFLLITNYDTRRPIGSTPSANGNFTTVDSVSEELQLQGKAFGEMLDYIVGGFYQEIKTEIIYPQSYFGLAPVLPPTSVTTNWKQKDTTEAVFAHFTVDLGRAANLDGLKLSFGGRYAWEKISVVHQPVSPEFGLLTDPFKDDRASWNVGLEYQATSNVMLYAAARESWRSGGINGASPPHIIDNTVNPPVLYDNTDKFKSEVAQDFEVGAKYNGHLSNMPTRLNFSAYTMRVDNVQRVLFPDNPFVPGANAFGITVNVPRARIKGVELEASVKPAKWLELGGNAAYTKATYTKNEVVIFAGAPQQVGFFFGPFADTPKITAAAYVVVTIPIGENSDVRLRGDVYTQSHSFFSSLDDTLNPGSRLPSYTIANFLLAFDNIVGTGVGVSTWVKNAFNEKYYVGGVPLSLALGVNSGNVGRPRMYGMDVSYKF